MKPLIPVLFLFIVTSCKKEDNRTNVITSQSKAIVSIVMDKRTIIVDSTSVEALYYNKDSSGFRIKSDHLYFSATRSLNTDTFNIDTAVGACFNYLNSYYSASYNPSYNPCGVCVRNTDNSISFFIFLTLINSDPVKSHEYINGTISRF